MSLVLGIISDTHGLLRPEAAAALAGCAAIIHAGDVGDPGILSRLRETAPVHAVRGNVDTEPWCRTLPLDLAVRLAGVSIYVLHNLEELRRDPKADGHQIVISGHTHQPASRSKDGVLYLNPGSAGPRRFSLPICLARMDLQNSPWRPEFVTL